MDPAEARLTSAEEKRWLVEVGADGRRVDARQRIHFRVLRRHRGRAPQRRKLRRRRGRQVFRRRIAEQENRVLLQKILVTLEVRLHLLLGVHVEEVLAHVDPVDRSSERRQVFYGRQVSCGMGHHEDDDFSGHGGRDQHVLERTERLRPEIE